MKHNFSPATQFYITQAQPCPYLAGREERKLFTNLDTDNPIALNNLLTKQGFRRSQSVLYRPSCEGCSACLSVRVPVKNFRPRASHKRILRKNRDLLRDITPPRTEPSHYHIFKDYLNHRHEGGGMTGMGFTDFMAMVEDTPLATRLIEYRTAGVDTPIAVCLSDTLDDGLSMIYSFFKPDLAARSLGVYMILDHINMAIEHGLDYVYLGYWVPNSPKMHYKAQFAPLEVFRGEAWQPLPDPAALNPDTLTGCETPVPEQVLRLRLPD